MFRPHVPLLVHGQGGLDAPALAGAALPVYKSAVEFVQEDYRFRPPS